MNIKNKLITSFVAAVLGICLITGGTSAYFSDTASTNNTITTGSLNLGLNKEAIFQVEAFVPGETQETQFKLTNEGSMDMKDITLTTSYEIVDKGEPNNGDNMGEYLVVELLSNQELIFEKTLAELNGNPQQIAKEFPAGSTAKQFMIRITFKDNGENQNHFQTDQLKLNWEFEAVQL
ncbi:TasA family protein [Virgibacillus ihumii]|uniref:TasA family protein n=1 Tax=Virgibacillus ihumii TaxID=2686091 RepID=UPI00157CE40C|nr:TasA family protein [Virgibacillus ihumii]